MNGAPGPRIAVCDYGVGNLRSVERALQRGGADVVVTGDTAALAAADGVVLPGVGAFATAAIALRNTGLGDAVRSVVADGRPLLGVCLGFQVLFSDSDEGDGDTGLGLIPGHVRRLDATRARVPHVGWNTATVTAGSSLFDGIPSGTYLYFTHSYAAVPDDTSDIAATTVHGVPIVAAVQRGSVMGTQFHPEKSGSAGLRLYANFVAACAVMAR